MKQQSLRMRRQRSWFLTAFTSSYLCLIPPKLTSSFAASPTPPPTPNPCLPSWPLHLSLLMFSPSLKQFSRLSSCLLVLHNEAQQTNQNLYDLLLLQSQRQQIRRHSAMRRSNLSLLGWPFLELNHIHYICPSSMSEWPTSLDWSILWKIKSAWTWTLQVKNRGYGWITQLVTGRQVCHTNVQLQWPISPWIHCESNKSHQYHWSYRTGWKARVTIQRNHWWKTSIRRLPSRYKVTSLHPPEATDIAILVISSQNVGAFKAKHCWEFCFRVLYFQCQWSSWHDKLLLKSLARVQLLEPLQKFACMTVCAGVGEVVANTTFWSNTGWTLGFTHWGMVTKDYEMSLLHCDLFILPYILNHQRQVVFWV